MSRSGFTVVRRSYTPETLVHRHDFRQIVLPERGALEMTVEGTRGTVSGNHLAVIETGQEHVCWAPRPTDCLVVDLPADTLLDHTPANFRQLDARLATITHALTVELANGGLSDPLIADSLGRYLQAALRTRREADRPHSGLTASQKRVALAARDYLQAHLSDDLSLTEIAAATGVSVSHLQRCFRTHFGETVVDYIHRARLQEGAGLLRTTERSVTEIAFDVGFHDPSYFARRFRRAYGISPAAFRRAHE